MNDNKNNDVPEKLEKSKNFKESELQRAQDKIDSQIPKGETLICALGYVSFLCILPLVLLRDSKFGQYHGKQALVLAIFVYFFDFVQIFPPLIATIYTILKTIVIVYAIYMSFKGRYFKIPFIYSLSEKFTINITPTLKQEKAN